MFGHFGVRISHTIHSNFLGVSITNNRPVFRNLGGYKIFSKQKIVPISGEKPPPTPPFRTLTVRKLPLLGPRASRHGRRPFSNWKIEHSNLHLPKPRAEGKGFAVPAMPGRKKTIGFFRTKLL